MTQMTLRIPEELAQRIHRTARARGMSSNEFLRQVADAATDASLAGSAAERTRERLAAAGLLEIRTPTPRIRPPREEVAAAMHAAGAGTPLSDIVAADRG
jgi:hypothetical protein